MTKIIKSQKGQGLIEYLILVALVAVASISVVKVLQNTINSQFANTINSLQGNGRHKIQAVEVTDSLFKKKDLSDFMKGASNPNTQQKR